MGEGGKTSTGGAGDWARGPAKWAAVGLLGGASFVGLLWVLIAREPAPLHAETAGPITVIEATQSTDAPARRPDAGAAGMDGHEHANPAATMRAPEDHAGSTVAAEQVPDPDPQPETPWRPDSQELALFALRAVPEADAAMLAPYLSPSERTASERTTPRPASRTPSVDDEAPAGTSPRVADEDDAPAERTSDIPTPTIAARISVNTAGAEELDLLPGVGPVIAQRIIEERERGGPFRNLQDLQRVRGIGPKTAAKMADHVRFD